MNRHRLTKHDVPRAARRLADGRCPGCGGAQIQRHGDTVVCSDCKRGWSISKIEARMEGKVRPTKTPKGGIITTRASHEVSPVKRKLENR